MIAVVVFFLAMAVALIALPFILLYLIFKALFWLVCLIFFRPRTRVNVYPPPDRWR
jgi:hypothetical protein